MAKFKKALALVLSLAMVLTLAPVANVNAAAKYKISAKTTALAAGKTYNVKVTGVGKDQYVKVARTAGLTVKYNKKTIKASKKVAGTGKALTFKVTANGKEKAYNATIKVNIFNKKTNKKVKTLKTTRKIKALPVQELKIDSVEGATDAANTYKYIVAKFNQKFTSLAPSEITIRRESDGQLFMVEKVVLDADGKGATITLLGDNSQNATNFLRGNVDYKMTVTQNGKIAEKVFNLPEVAGDVMVYDVDASNRRIKAWNNNGNYNLVVPKDITVDFEDILGRTITAQYDKANTIKKLSVSEEKVVIGSFKATAADKKLKDLSTDEKYGLQVASGRVIATQVVWKGAKNTNLDGEDFVITADTVYDYAKLVLNSAGDVKCIVIVDEWDDNILVDEVKNTTVLGGKTEVNFKDYTIVKDGKTVTLADVKAGDVIFYNKAYLLADVYTSTKTGALDAVYDAKFKVGGKVYDVKDSAGNYITHYNKKGELRQNADNAYLDALFAAKKDVTIYLDRAGNAVYLTGETGEVASNKKTFILTDNAKYYHQSLADYIRITGFNGEANETIDINLADVTTIVNTAGTTYTKGKQLVNAAGNEVTGATNKVAGFKLSAALDTSPTTTGITDDSKMIKALYDATNDLATTPIVTDNIKAAMVAGELIVLTYNDKNVVTGISFVNGKSGSAAKIRAAVADTNLETLGADAYINGGATGKLKAGDTKITAGGTAYQLTKDTPVYTYTVKDGAINKVKLTKFGEFKGASKGTDSSLISVYTTDGINVAALVIDDAELDADKDGQKTFKAVISEIMNDTTDDKNVKYLKVFSSQAPEGVKKAEDKSIEFTTFAKKIPNGTTYEPGDIVDVTVAADLTTVNDIAAGTGAVGTQKTLTKGTTYASDKKFSIAEAGTLVLSTAPVPTLVLAEGTSNYTFTDISDKDVVDLYDGYFVTYAKDATSTVDTMIVWKDDSEAVINANKAISNTVKNLDPWRTGAGNDKLTRLTVSDAENGTTIAWTLEGSAITPDGDGNYTTSQNGNRTYELKATVSKAGGTTTTIAWAVRKEGTTAITDITEIDDIDKYEAAAAAITAGTVNSAITANPVATNVAKGSATQVAYKGAAIAALATATSLSESTYDYTVTGASDFNLAADATNTATVTISKDGFTAVWTGVKLHTET